MTPSTNTEIRNAPDGAVKLVAIDRNGWSRSVGTSGHDRRNAQLIGLGAGTICYAIFRPVSLATVANAPILVAPHLFPFGHAVEANLVIIFLLVLLPASIGSMALYQMVGEWGGQSVTSSRMSQGVFAIGLGGVIAGNRAVTRGSSNDVDRASASEGAHDRRKRVHCILEAERLIDSSSSRHDRT